MAIEAVLIGPSWPGLLLNRQFLLARLPACVSPGFTTPGGSLRFAHRGLISFTPPACKPAARKGCRTLAPGWAKRYPGSPRPLNERTLKACEEIPVEQQARPGGAAHDIQRFREASEESW